MAGVLTAVHGWLDRNIFELGRQMRLSYLPPLMVYVAAGISGLTGIVGVFYVKERLGLSAEFLAALGFWGGLPWALKMPLGHLVDLRWRWKSLLVYLGASLIAASLLRDPVTAKWLEIVFYKLSFVYNLFGTQQLANHVAEMPLRGTGSYFWSVNAEERFICWHRCCWCWCGANGRAAWQCGRSSRSSHG